MERLRATPGVPEFELERLFDLVVGALPVGGDEHLPTLLGWETEFRLAQNAAAFSETLAD